MTQSEKYGFKGHSILNMYVHCQDKGKGVDLKAVFKLSLGLITVGSNHCQCGRTIGWHKDKDLEVNLGTEHIKWHPKTHTKLMPCDSF